MSELYALNMDDEKREIYFEHMEPTSAKVFWHIVTLATQEQLLEWTKKVVMPIEEARLKKVKDNKDTESAKVSRLQSLKNWFSRSYSSSDAGEDAKAKEEGDILI